MPSLQLRFLLLFTLTCGACVADELSPIQDILESRCVHCHNADDKSGGVNLAAAIASFDPTRDLETWVKIDAAIASRKMPPSDEPQLDQEQLRAVANWFERQFVKPDGIEHAGPNFPRRLTREELQNTLEDILHVNLRVTVTNSRLHVIPDTIVEKFFETGVVGASGFSNDALTLAKESIDIQTYARCLSLVLNMVDTTEPARTHLFGKTDVPRELPLDEARKIIQHFGRSAYRRELNELELDSFVAVYQRSIAKHPPYNALKSSFLAILLSPPFLFRFEGEPESQAPVVGNELAVRLSYFLWSAPPDETLLKLASEGKLRDPAVLVAQVRRMLADPRRIALGENLGGEWFEYKKLRQQSSVNKRSDKMAGFYRTQFEEALLFFDSLIRYDQPIFRLVDADWAFTNRHQSGIYRLSTSKTDLKPENALPPINLHYRDADRKIAVANYEYKHAPLELVKLNNPNRGGFLTLGPSLSVTSTENRTSPIRRGVFIMERILGEHFKQPEDVPDLETTQKKAENKNLSHNEILKLHSSQKGCAACHQYIDPIGFGLEMYDQLGIRRDVNIPTPGGEKLTWSPKETPKSYADQTWTITKPLVPGKETRVFFQYTKGRHRYDIKNVRLVAGDIEIWDKHFGFTGGMHRDNVWYFPIPAEAPTTGWKLIAEVKGDGGSDSNGIITIAGPDDKFAGHKLPNGKSFATPAELKKVLLEDYREQFTDNVIKRVFAYALGRKVLPTDRPALKEIRTSIEKQDFRMTALIEAVVMSYPFRHKEKSAAVITPTTAETN